jgi:hypothetical protein
MRTPQRLLDEGRYASISEMAQGSGSSGGTLARCSASRCWRRTSWQRSWMGGMRAGPVCRG